MEMDVSRARSNYPKWKIKKHTKIKKTLEKTKI